MSYYPKNDAYLYKDETIQYLMDLGYSFKEAEKMYYDEVKNIIKMSIDNN